MLCLFCALPIISLAEDAEYGTDDVVDHRSSEPTAGVVTPTDWFIPNIPDPEKADPEEYKDYLGTVDSPYAFLKVPNAFQYNQQKVSAGFYLVKFHMPNASPRPARKILGFKMDKLGYPPTYPQTVGSPNIGLMLKKEGEIVTEVPIQDVEHFAPPPKTKWYKFGRRFKEHTQERPAPRAAVIPMANNPNLSDGFQIQYCDETICYRSIPLAFDLLK